ncbi:MAG: hypothetical protein K0Q96_1201 [Rubrobacteraceae bacterium]|nr:hypothetical protein [Rubrobacteraceae bacterium]
MQGGDAGGDVGGDGLATRRVTMREAADLLGVSKEAIRKRVVRGTLPSEMGEDGRRYVYLEAGRDVAAAEEPTHEHDVNERDVLIPEMVGELHDELHYLREQLNLELERRSAEAKSFQQTIRALTSANASLTERLRALEPPQGMPSVNQDVATDGAGDDSDEGPPDAEWSTFVLPSVEWLAFVAPVGPSVAAILFEVSLWGPAVVQRWFYAAAAFALLPTVFGLTYGRYRAKSSRIRHAIREREIEAARRSRAAAMPVEVPPDDVRAAIMSGFKVAILTAGLSAGGDFLVRYLFDLPDVISPLLVLGSMVSAVFAAMLWISSALFGIELERQRTRWRTGEPTRKLNFPTILGFVGVLITAVAGLIAAVWAAQITGG